MVLVSNTVGSRVGVGLESGLILNTILSRTQVGLTTVRSVKFINTVLVFPTELLQCCYGIG